MIILAAELRRASKDTMANMGDQGGGSHKPHGVDKTPRAWLSGVGTPPQIKRPSVRFLVRAHARASGSVAVGAYMRGNRLMFFSLFLSSSLPFSLKISK